MPHPERNAIQANMATTTFLIAFPSRFSIQTRCQSRHCEELSCPPKPAFGRRRMRRSNPVFLFRLLDCFASLAMTELLVVIRSQALQRRVVDRLVAIEGAGDGRQRIFQAGGTIEQHNAIGLLDATVLQALL